MDGWTDWLEQEDNLKIVTAVSLVQHKPEGGLRVETRMEFWENANSQAESEGFAARAALDKNPGFQIVVIGSLVIEK